MEHLVERKNSHYSFALWVLSLLFFIAGIFSLKLDMAPQIPEKQESTKTIPDGLSNGHPIKMEIDETGVAFPEKKEDKNIGGKPSESKKTEPDAGATVILKDIPEPKKEEPEKKTGKDGDKGISCQERGDCWNIIVDRH